MPEYILLVENILILEIINFRTVEPFCLEKFKEKPPKGKDFKPPYFDQEPVKIAQAENLARQAVRLVAEDDTTEKFWIRLHNLKVANEYKYRVLTTGVIKMLCLPISNAEVERTFSTTKFFKNWHRSRLSNSLMKEMLHVKFGLKLTGKKASAFEIPREILKIDQSIYRFKKPDNAENK